MTSPIDVRFMQLALSLGERGCGQVWPNPAVGCVIVKNDRVIGRGTTATGGRPHAEVVALAQAGSRAKDATVYVTLEPCAHTGKTPPCAQALINAGVARVVVACTDPDPRVNGGGIAMLQAAGISVETNILAHEARARHAGFLKRVTQGLPFVTLKLATTIDGRIATQTGESQWITGPDARRVVHAMRARHDAVMVGAGTVRADDPQLTVRGMGQVRQPVRVVISTDLKMSVKAGLFQTTDTAPVWVCHGPNADTEPYVELGVKALPCDVADGRVDIEGVLRALARQGITRVFSEGGGRVAASLLKAGLVDRLEVFQAGKVIGDDGIAAIAGMDIAALGDARQFKCRATRHVGPDIWTSWDALTP